MQLKQYQTDTLAILRRFLEEARIAGPKAAYEVLVSEPDQASKLGRYADKYVPLKELPEVPYICLRLPTGGGKTLELKREQIIKLPIILSEHDRWQSAVNDAIAARSSLAKESERI